MREFGGFIAALWLAGCSTDSAPPVAAQQRTQQVEVESDIVLAPSEPTPAFAPARDGACPSEYRLVEGSCVHHAYRSGDDAALSSALDAYRRGAVPPMLGPAKAKVEAPPPKQPLDPGALAKRASADAGAAQERRLAELDAMIAAAKEKLRERDEHSRAKRVDSPPRARDAGAAASPALVPAPAFAAGGAAPASVNAAADPTVARLSELSQLVNQLPPEQLQAITNQLTGAGMNSQELESMMNSARAGQ